MDSRKVEMDQDKVELAKKVTLNDGSVVDVKWHYYVPDVGNAIQITTGQIARVYTWAPLFRYCCDMRSVGFFKFALYIFGSSLS